MRVLATWEPSDLPSFHETEPGNLLGLGMLSGVDAPGFFSPTWDPRPDAPKIDDTGLSWARETPRGIELRRHPEAEILNHRRAYEMVDRWRATTSRDLTQDHYDHWSNYAIESWLVMTCATRREESRQMTGGSEHGNT